jgi:hypothetical protein
MLTTQSFTMVGRKEALGMGQLYLGLMKMDFM